MSHKGTEQGEGGRAESERMRGKGEGRVANGCFSSATLNLEFYYLLGLN